MQLRQIVTEAFKQTTGTAPAYLVRAPGRVNLIGEHTDYNDGFVLPMAIDRAIWMAVRPRRDRQVIVHSLDFNTSVEFSLEGLTKSTGWAEYIKGMAWAMTAEGHRLEGWEGTLTGDVPMDAGLSSSAALEMAAGRAFCAVAGIAWEARRMAEIARKAENEWVGVNCGIMDQMVCAAAKAGSALFLDCRSLACEHVRIPPGISVVVLDTGTRRGLSDTAYNARRAQCEAAARFLGVRALRDIDIDTFNMQYEDLDPLTRRRARHVISENGRVLRAVEALARGDVAVLGSLLNASHASLRDDFEVSSDALNRMVDSALQHPACYGARMTGAGFGGCVVAIVRQDAAPDFAAWITETYIRQTRQTPQAIVCRSEAGASISVIS